MVAIRSPGLTDDCTLVPIDYSQLKNRQWRAADELRANSRSLPQVLSAGAGADLLALGGLQV